MANVSVYFKPIVFNGMPTPYYHEFLVYTPGSGSVYGAEPQYFRGGPASSQGLCNCSPRAGSYAAVGSGVPWSVSLIARRIGIPRRRAVSMTDLTLA